MNYDLTEQAYKELRKFPIDIQRRLILKIKHYLASDDPLHFADHIEGRLGKTYRFRVGTVRILFDWHNDRILVTKIAKRSEVYQ